MDGRRAGVAVALAAMLIPTAYAASTALTAAEFQNALASGATLESRPTATVFTRHFEASCGRDVALPFDRTCMHVAPRHADDPTPWPDAMLALQGRRIVAVVVDDATWVPRGWRCTRLPDFDGPRLCTPPGTPARTNRAWTRRWNAVLRAAG